jgi:hypothetical protein
MKINLTEVRSRKSEVRNLASGGPLAADFRPPASECGIALVLTLILLSVTLVMAIAFLAISRRERGSVTTSTDTATARLAADSALANAEAQIMANMLSTTNPFSFGLLVSTNYINANAFTNGSSNPLNVNYYDSSGNLLTGANLQQNIANLFYLPRPPVFVTTNQQTGGTEFRYYLDLNRNGKFEDTGSAVTNFDSLGDVLGTIPEVGDPQWIGVLERPDTTHGPNNKFLSRYAFIALPAGNSLDLNAIHNQTMTRTVNASPTTSVSDGYYRNQGVGSWEINLAAFLTDLNTNQWDTTTAPYNYLEPGFVNTGFAFQDALALLSYRYDYFYNSLSSVQNLFNLNVQAAFRNNIDFYSDLVPPLTIPNGQIISLSWAGADNTNHFFTPGELYNSNEISAGFVNRLLAAGNTNSTYNRYTFYRLLAQLGTDSTPESGKMNLNYDNLDSGFNGALDVNGSASITNFVPWTAIGFFTNAADRMLRFYTANWFRTNPSNYLATYYGITGDAANYYYNYTNGFGITVTVTNDPTGLGLTNIPFFGMTNIMPVFGVTNIPVWVNGQFVYSSAMQRVLQLAANIYDATTNNTFALGLNYPSVFRPTFLRTNQNGFANVYVNGYQPVFSVSGTSDPQLNQPIDATGLLLGTSVANYGINGINVYGVPWIIGAKKGFPNFNEFSMQDVVQITRKLQVSRLNTNSLPNMTNQMYVFSITNSLGIECWNSYTNSYPSTNNFQIFVRNNLSMQMSNGASSFLLGNPVYLYQFNQATTVPVWPGNSFILPFYTNLTVLTNSVYDFAGSFIPVGRNPNPPTFANITPSFFAPFPQTLLYLTNQLQVFMLDGNHVIDYVHFSGPPSVRNLSSEFQNTNSAFSGNDVYYTNGVWSLALTPNSIPWGIQNQIDISIGQHQDLTYWNYNNTTVQSEIDGFLHFLNPTNSSLFGTQSNFLYSTNLAVQVPYTPTITTYEYTTWQANDPLVHYLQSDLNYSGYDTASGHEVTTGIHQPSTAAILPDIGKVNARYQPWGVNKQFNSNQYDQSPYNLAFKDPLVSQSDIWDFTTNKFPTVGWLGRVHRGTPWQTVYLKASDILRENNTFLQNIGTNTWELWSGNNNIFDAVNTAPLQDRLLFDIFTTAPNDNATRGQLSINVGAGPGGTNGPSLAAWSAVFSGMVALTNTTLIPLRFPQTNLPVIIQPAGPAVVNSALGQLVVGINNARATFTNADGLVGVFEHVGDILSTLQLTEASPFLNTNYFTLNGDISGKIPGSEQLLYGISDEMYEWLPQQAMSLLHASSAPRYVIYSYGQTLKPAVNGIVTGGPFFGMVANYQIAAEIATRAVVRVEGITGADGTPLPPSQAHPHIVIESYNILPPD